MSRAEVRQKTNRLVKQIKSNLSHPTINQALLYKCAEGSYSHRMSFLYLRTRHTAAVHVMTLPGQLIKPFDPFMFMSHKSGFTAAPASNL